MASQNVTVNISRNKKLEDVIMTFFTKAGGLFECNACSKLLRGYNFIMKQHLKSHHLNLWESYLCMLGTDMKKDHKRSVKPTLSKKSVLKCQVDFVSAAGVKVSLSLPESRVPRDKFLNDDLSVMESLNGFKGRMQKEFNKDPYGPYMGPFDQSEKLPLKLQLPKSELTFQSYTEFRHNGTECQSYSIKKSYREIDDLEKIDSLEIKVADSATNKDKIVYTCKSHQCRIPCICKDCCVSDSQCKLHKIKHADMFDYERDSMTIRSSETVFKDSSFLSNSYTIRYPKIPIDCSQCSNDLLHHNLYHLKYHESCKFCLQIRHKLKPSTVQALQREVKFHEKYMSCICPHCDKEFVERHKRDEHVEYAHGKKRLVCSLCDEHFASKQALVYHEDMVHKNVSYRKKFMDIDCPHCDQKFLEKLKRDNHVKYVHGNNRLVCNLCEENFASKQALVYHEDTVHKKSKQVNCEECESSFTSSISLKNHRKYVHSDVRRFTCCLCGALFKQKKDRTFHIRNKHQVNTNDHYMNEWNIPEERTRFQCNLCDSSYKYKKGLEAHKKENHDIQSIGSDSERKFKCDVCSLSYKNKKGLKEHKEIKHETHSFSCKICGKTFGQKNNCLRHERNHK